MKERNERKLQRGKERKLQEGMKDKIEIWIDREGGKLHVKFSSTKRCCRK
jgi:hypothetical protein